MKAPFSSHIYWLILPLFFSHFLWFSSAQSAELLQGIFSEEVLVDLRRPTYSDGVLETVEGGVIHAKNIRIQAAHIRYERKSGQKQQANLLAEKDLSVEFKEFLFVGERIEYDFILQTGVIYCGRVAVGPWLFGGKTIFLHANGTCSIENAFLTTDSAQQGRSWQLQAKNVSLLADGTLVGRDLAVYIGKIPVLWLPRLTFDPLRLTESPLDYTFGWGGKQGPRIGAKYISSFSKTFKAGVRVDYHIKHGLGAGVETRYRSEDRKTTFKTINYLARDITVNLERQYHTRYRFQGIYKRYIEEKMLNIDLSYDKVSDIEMPSDYSESDLGIIAAGKSQLLIRSQSDKWLITTQARARLNSFQTMKQELPSFEWSFRPALLEKVGVLYDSRWRAAYLDYDYAHENHATNDYHSTRFEMRWRLWRPVTLSKWAMVTAEVQSINILYGNSINGREGHLLNSEVLGLSAYTFISRSFSRLKHTITPYALYRYALTPTLEPNEHFIFDIQDGWAHLNVLRCGIKQKISFYKKCDFIPSIQTNLYADTFFNTKKVLRAIPRLFFDIEIIPTSFLRLSVNSAWYFPKQVVDHINFKTDWTVNNNLAFSAEYRRRSRYSWRKVDPDNLFLDSYRSVHELVHSAVSDQRDTILLNSFWRFHPFAAIEAKIHKGWHRRREPPYSEYDTSLLLSLPAYWYVKLSYQRSEGDHRFALYFALRPPPQANKLNKRSCP